MLLYKVKKIEEGATLKCLAISKLEKKNNQVFTKKAKQRFLYSASDHFEPKTKTGEDTSD